MAGTAVVLYGIVAVVVVIGAWMAAKGHGHLRTDARALAVLQAARRRSLVAMGFALVILLAGVATAPLVPEWLGVGATLAPALAGVGGLVLYAVTPPPKDTGTQMRYSASLRPRTPWSIAPSPALVPLSVMLILQISLLIFTGATSSVDERGRFRAITFAADAYSSTASPYPGWFYAVPLLIGTVLLAIATWIALRRIATTASLPGEGLEDLDDMWRSRSAHVVVGLATAAVCFQFGGSALFAGTTMGNAQFQLGVPVGWQVLATGLTGLGFVSLLLSIVALTLAALRAFALTRHVVRTDVTGGRRA